MYRTNLLFFLISISISSISTKVELNSTTTTTTVTSTVSVLTGETIFSSCTYCQTKACRCSSKENILNCSSYLLNLTFASNCAEMKIWNIVDFSSRNLEFFDSNRLLSLRMFRLSLKSNSISTIYDNTFDSIGDVLIELDLQMNQLSNVTSNWLNSKLTQLKILNLALNQLQSLIYVDHVHLPHLQELNLSRNQMEIFPNQIQQWRSLVKLDLSYNKLSSIPRFALTYLQNLTWLSLASNRHLSCIIQDSFKYLKSLKYLDVSSTNLIDLDGCIFIQLSNLRSLKIERVSINCSSCWLPIAKKNSIKLFGQCVSNNTLQQLDSLTSQQIDNSCSRSSIDCSIDYCEPGSSKTSASGKFAISTRDDNTSKNRTIEIVLGIIFSIIGLIIIILVIVFIYRWKTGKKLFCCDFLSPTSSTMTEVKRRRHRRQHQKQIIDRNPTVIESVVTHGANMNVPPYPHHHYAYGNESTSNTKRKLYNPMFTDSPTSDRRDQQAMMLSNDSRFENNHLYSENL